MVVRYTVMHYVAPDHVEADGIAVNMFECSDGAISVPSRPIATTISISGSRCRVAAGYARVPPIREERVGRFQ